MKVLSSPSLSRVSKQGCVGCRISRYTFAWLTKAVMISHALPAFHHDHDALGSQTKTTVSDNKQAKRTDLLLVPKLYFVLRYRFVAVLFVHRSHCIPLSMAVGEERYLRIVLYLVENAAPPRLIMQARARHLQGSWRSSTDMHIRDERGAYSPTLLGLGSST